VLGNHDLDEGEGERIAAVLRDLGIVVLEGGAATVDVRGIRVGVAGMRGFGGGVDPAAPAPADYVETSSGVVESTASGARLEAALAGLDADVRIALTHYAPCAGTLEGEPPAIWDHLGSHLLGAAVDAGRAHLAVHGHAHHGSEAGWTAGGVPVRNVARPVIRRPYAVYELSATGRLLRGAHTT